MLAVTPFLDQQNLNSWKAFAGMIENPSESREFAGCLREEMN
jgi:hypothetical protein